jgi:GH43 family beta-xylosidase
MQVATLAKCFQYGNGKLYFIWSGWTDLSSTLEQNLYIVTMGSPTSISDERVLLHQPTQA